MGLFGNNGDAKLTHIKVDQETPSMLKASGACRLHGSGEMVKVNISLTRTEYGQPILKVSTEDGAEYSDPDCVREIKKFLKENYDGI